MLGDHKTATSGPQGHGTRAPGARAVTLEPSRNHKRIGHHAFDVVRGAVVVALDLRHHVPPSRRLDDFDADLAVTTGWSNSGLRTVPLRDLVSTIVESDQ